MNKKREIEYANYLGMDTYSSHPLFQFIDTPPEGYAFVSNPGEPRNVERILEMISQMDPWRRPAATGLKDIDHTIDALWNVARNAHRYGATMEQIRTFFMSRSIAENMRVPAD